MKQTLTLITAGLFMLISYTLKAQDSSDPDDETKQKLKSYVSLSGGISKPFGDFAQHDYFNTKAGFASKAVAYAIDGAVYFHRNWAIGYTASFQDQGGLSGADDQQLADAYTDDFRADVSTVTANKRYHSYNFMVGPQYTFVWRRLSFDIRASAGAIKSLATPEITVDLTGVETQPNSFTQESSKATAFAYGASGAVRFDMGAGWGLSLKGNYINSAGVKITTEGRTSSLGRIVTKQPITEGQLLFGLVKSF